MRDFLQGGPIIAPSTCTLGNGAVALIRISGFNNLEDFRSSFSVSGPIEPRRVYYTQLKHHDLHLDDICLTFFSAPKSYTGENVLELSVHGNQLNVSRIIQHLMKQHGLRSASPGEFTYRALKNKKLTLSQVEGLDLFLNAQSDYALDQGLSLLSGELQNLYQSLYQSLIKHRSALELMIDFSEDVGEETAKQYFHSSFDEFKKFLFVLYQRANKGTSHLLQPEIVLLGKPNSGKSSLFNKMLAQDRAIVSPVAGTTRDYISESYSFNNVIYKLTDTAGLRETHDPIEAEGVKRTERKMAEAFFRILLINPLDPELDFLPKDFDLAFFTHADLPGFAQAKSNFIQHHPSFGSIGAISLLNGFESEKLLEINAIINKKYLSFIENKPILLTRHQELILSSWNHSFSYEKLSKSVTDVGILSHELNALTSCLEELIGIVSPHQVLDSVFNNFCIGK